MLLTQSDRCFAFKLTPQLTITVRHIFCGAFVSFLNPRETSTFLSLVYFPLYYKIIVDISIYLVYLLQQRDAPKHFLSLLLEFFLTKTFHFVMPGHRKPTKMQKDFIGLSLDFHAPEPCKRAIILYNSFRV